MDFSKERFRTELFLISRATVGIFVFCGLSGIPLKFPSFLRYFGKVLLASAA